LEGQELSLKLVLPGLQGCIDGSLVPVPPSLLLTPFFGHVSFNTHLELMGCRSADGAVVTSTGELPMKVVADEEATEYDQVQK